MSAPSPREASPMAPETAALLLARYDTYGGGMDALEARALAVLIDHARGDVALAALPAVPGELVAWLDEQVVEARDLATELVKAVHTAQATGDQGAGVRMWQPIAAAENRADVLTEVRDRLTRPVSPEGDGADDGGRGR